MFLSLALRNIWRNRARSFITLLSIGSGCVAVILAGGFIEHAVDHLRESYIRDFIGHLRVYQPGYLQNGTLHPYDFMIAAPDPIIEKIKAVPHVSYVAPRLSFSGLLSNGDSTLSLFVEGVDPQAETPQRNAAHLEEGRYFEAGNAYQILLGKGLAKALGAQVGDSLVLVTNTTHGAMNASDLTVRGIFSTDNKSFDDHSARIPLRTAQMLLRTTGVQMLVVFIDRTALTPQVKTDLEAGLKADAMDVKAWYELDQADFVLKAIAFYKRIFLVLKIIIILVVALSVVNTMNMSVVERIGEIGTLMALGTRRGGIVRLFLLEGLVMGLLGGILGCVAGIILAKALSIIGIPMPTPPGTTSQWIARFIVTPEVCNAALGMSVITAIFASVLPALKASRLDLGDALRHNV